MKAVAVIRRCAGGVRTGHAGTLDPLATGLLVIALGGATRSIERIMGDDKRYLTEIDLAAFTSTDDREGERMEIAVTEPPALARVAEALRGFVGTIRQRPPAFSAIKVAGRRAYRMARRGDAPTLPERPVTVHAIELLRYDYPIVTLAIHCGKGTYIRSIARDLGAALGTGGHCASIRRTAIGSFTVEDAFTERTLPGTIGQAGLRPVPRAD